MFKRHLQAHSFGFGTISENKNLANIQHHHETITLSHLYCVMFSWIWAMARSSFSYDLIGRYFWPLLCRNFSQICTFRNDSEQKTSQKAAHHLYCDTIGTRCHTPTATPSWYGFYKFYFAYRRVRRLHAMHFMLWLRTQPNKK